MRIAILAAGLLGVHRPLSASAQAQTAPAGRPGLPLRLTAAGGFSDADLKAVRFGDDRDPEDQRRVRRRRLLTPTARPRPRSRKEMIGKMGAAVQASGLSPQKYNDMSAAVQKDAALRARLTSVLNAEPAV